jgi:hypothetical protein
VERYEIKRIITSDVVVVINRVATLEGIIIGVNDYIYDTEMECGIIL